MMNEVTFQVVEQAEATVTYGAATGDPPPPSNAHGLSGKEPSTSDETAPSNGRMATDEEIDPSTVLTMSSVARPKPTNTEAATNPANCSSRPGSSNDPDALQANRDRDLLRADSHPSGTGRQSVGRRRGAEPPRLPKAPRTRGAITGIDCRARTIRDRSNRLTGHRRPIRRSWRCPGMVSSIKGHSRNSGPIRSPKSSRRRLLGNSKGSRGASSPITACWCRSWSTRAEIVDGRESLHNLPEARHRPLAPESDGHGSLIEAALDLNGSPGPAT